MTTSRIRQTEVQNVLDIWQNGDRKLQHLARFLQLAPRGGIDDLCVCRTVTDTETLQIRVINDTDTLHILAHTPTHARTHARVHAHTRTQPDTHPPHPRTHTQHNTTQHSTTQHNTMVAISQATFSNAFRWMKLYKLRLGFHWWLSQGSN